MEIKTLGCGQPPQNGVQVSILGTRSSKQGRESPDTPIQRGSLYLQTHLVSLVLAANKRAIFVDGALVVSQQMVTRHTGRLVER